MVANYWKTLCGNSLIVAVLFVLAAGLGGGDARAQEFGPRALNRARSDDAAPAAKSVPQAVDADKGADTRTLTVTGTCVDEDRRPIAEVDITLYRRDRRPEERVVRIQEARTTAEGRYRFEDLPAPMPQSGISTYVTVAVANGRASQMVYARNEEGVEDQVVVMRPAATLRGRVSGPDGEPVSGACVWTQGIVEEPLPGVFSTRTDAEGRYELADLEPLFANRQMKIAGRDGLFVSRGRVLRVRHPDFAQQCPLYQEVPATFNVRLSHGGNLEGRVLDGVTGEPAANVAVTLRSTAHESGDNWRQTRTNDAGMYKVTGLGPANYHVWADAPDRTCVALDSIEVLVRQTGHAPDLRLIEGSWIEGHVVGPGVRPITLAPETKSRLMIGVNGPSRPGKGRGLEMHLVDDDGRFRIRVAPGRNFLSILSNEIWARTLRRAELEKGIEIEDGKTIKLLLRVQDENVPTGVGEN